MEGKTLSIRVAGKYGKAKICMKNKNMIPN